MKLGEQAAWMSTDIHTKQCEVWGSCSSDREKLCILLLCHALQSDRYWPTFWRTPLPPLVEYKKNSWPRKDPGTWWQDTDLQVFGSLVSSGSLAELCPYSKPLLHSSVSDGRATNATEWQYSHDWTL